MELITGISVFALFILIYKVLQPLSSKLSTNKTVEDQPKFGKRSQTNDGDTVRSKGEKKIADYLSALGVKYVYEPPMGNMLPDFWLPVYGLIIEYWGLATEEGETGKDYREKMANKLGKYQEKQVDVLSIMPEDIRDKSYQKKINKVLGF